MSHAPTDEQQAIIDVFGERADLVIDAAAGAGKTSTLKMVANAAPKLRGAYIAYNRSVAVEAANDFPGAVQCKTQHGFAMASVGRTYRHRLNAGRLPVGESARIMGINQALWLGNDVNLISQSQVARLVMETIRKFCYSADEQIGAHHVPKVNGINTRAAENELRKVIVPLAQNMWDTDITSPNGRLRFEHDHYLKIWALSKPTFDADYVMLDEAQDSNGCVAAVVEQQQIQRILVGDRCQSIYGWRGATDAMENFNGKRLVLSQSFRFGPEIAHEANKWLSILDVGLRVRGYDALDSRVGFVARPDAVLCRTNGAAVRTIAEQTEAGRRVAFVGGASTIIKLAEAAAELKATGRTTHPELFAFTSWADVQAYVEQDSAGADLQVTVNLIDKYGPDGLIAIMSRLVDERSADLVVSTAHKAKGREWNTVRIADDFVEPKSSKENPEPKISRSDAMLAYVTVTRARQVLDRSGLAWVDNWV